MNSFPRAFICVHPCRMSRMRGRICIHSTKNHRSRTSLLFNHSARRRHRRLIIVDQSLSRITLHSRRSLSSNNQQAVALNWSLASLLMRRVGYYEQQGAQGCWGKKSFRATISIFRVSLSHSRCCLIILFVLFVDLSLSVDPSSSSSIIHRHRQSIIVDHSRNAINTRLLWIDRLPFRLSVGYYYEPARSPRVFR